MKISSIALSTSATASMHSLHVVVEPGLDYRRFTYNVAQTTNTQALLTKKLRTIPLRCNLRGVCTIQVNVATNAQ